MTETYMIEGYLQNTLPAEERLLMEAKLLLDQDLRESVYWQEQTYQLIRQHARKQLKEEIQAVHSRLFSEPTFKSFKQHILSIFKL